MNTDRHTHCLSGINWKLLTVGVPFSADSHVQAHSNMNFTCWIELYVLN